ncbi:MAG TPA: hypothetical protein VMW66_06100 [Elusimicrobiales bacterium]|nr:hypothetical protein [Elusimicrobiales bacterium]
MKNKIILFFMTMFCMGFMANAVTPEECVGLTGLDLTKCINDVNKRCKEECAGSNDFNQCVEECVNGSGGGDDDDDDIPGNGKYDYSKNDPARCRLYGPIDKCEDKNEVALCVRMMHKAAIAKRIHSRKRGITDELKKDLRDKADNLDKWAIGLAFRCGVRDFYAVGRNKLDIEAALNGDYDHYAKGDNADNFCCIMYHLTQNMKDSGKTETYNKLMNHFFGDKGVCGNKGVGCKLGNYKQYGLTGKCRLSDVLAGKECRGGGPPPPGGGGGSTEGKGDDPIINYK